MGLLRILDILRTHSDSNHKLTHKDIITHLEEDYGIVMERKAISNNIEALREAGYDIISTVNGTYMNSHEFEDSELRMLIDGVLSSKYITVSHSKSIIERLCNISNKFFKANVKHIYSVDDWSKSSNQDLFYNIELIDEAIEQKKKISFNYNKFGVDKMFHVSSTPIVSPYQMILHNQRYYLMSYNDKWEDLAFYRIDHITNMQILDDKAHPLKKIPGFEKGIDYKELSTAKPYMYSDQSENISFIAEASIVDQIVDWFGDNAIIKQSKDDATKVIVNVKASPNAMENWALQYLSCVEITAPASLRNRIKKIVSEGLENYK